MLKGLPGGILGLVLFAGAQAQAACSYTYTFTSGATAVASQVNQDLNDIVNCALQASGGTLSNGTLSGTTALPGSGAITSTGGLGVGIASPAIVGDGTEMFAATGIIYSNYDNGGDAGTLRLRSSSNGKMWMFTQRASTSYNLEFWNYNGSLWTDVMDITPAANVGIHTTSPSYPLQVNGSVAATQFVTTSDRRSKTDIKPLEPDAVDIVARLKPVSFMWREPRAAKENGRQIGFVAQDVAAVVPDAVLTAEDDQKMLSINYNSLIPILTKALQQQQAEIAELTAAVRTLQSANNNFRQKVEEIRDNGGGKNVRRAAQ